MFDLDGVLVDSESVWDAARREVVARKGGRWQADATRAHRSGTVTCTTNSVCRLSRANQRIRGRRALPQRPLGPSAFTIILTVAPYVAYY